MATMTTPSLKAGNLTECPAPVTVRQALLERRRRENLCEDMTYELSIMKSTFQSCCGDRLRGYIQGVGLDPFWVLFYVEEQVNVFIEQCKQGRLVLHVDSTGSVMRRIPQQKQPYYYAIVVADGSFPVCEFITTRHFHAWIMIMMDMFLNDARELNDGKKVLPQVIVVDFSFALIYAVLLAFNRCTLSRYLQLTWNRLQVEEQLTPFPQVIVKLCCAHLLKAAANRMCRREKQKEARQAALVLLSAMQKCCSLRRAGEVYCAAKVILCTELETADCRSRRCEVICIDRKCT